MEYYHNLVTQKSWKELKSLKQKVNFVLIGGWATYLYTKALKSKDIDIVVGFEQLSILGKYYDLFKNSRLKKYEAKKGPVEIDIYLPHFSEIGIPVEDLLEKVNIVNGYKVVELNTLLALKIFTLGNRGRTPKGRKDFLDLISLFALNKPNSKNVLQILAKYSLLDTKDVFIKLLSENTALPELEINPHKYAKLKKEILQYFG